MFEFYDLHTHTTFSDGVLIPAESVRRGKVNGYSGMALTDHADESNYKFIIENQKRFQESFNKISEFKIIVGVEFTHVKPSILGKLVCDAREFGADIVVVHGETIVEPVEKRTNRAAIDSGADILAHPGLIDEEDVKLAVKNNVALELTTRKGHSYTNGYVYSVASKYGATVVLNNDFHAPGDGLDINMLQKVLRGVGVGEAEMRTVFDNNKNIFYRCLGGESE